MVRKKTSGWGVIKPGVGDKRIGNDALLTYDASHWMKAQKKKKRAIAIGYGEGEKTGCDLPSKGGSITICSMFVEADVSALFQLVVGHSLERAVLKEQKIFIDHTRRITSAATPKRSGCGGVRTSGAWVFYSIPCLVFVAISCFFVAVFHTHCFGGKIRWILRKKKV